MHDASLKDSSLSTS